jgi:hypothetical protein
MRVNTVSNKTPWKKMNGDELLQRVYNFNY